MRTYLYLLKSLNQVKVPFLGYMLLKPQFWGFIKQCGLNLTAFIMQNIRLDMLQQLLTVIYQYRKICFITTSTEKRITFTTENAAVSVSPK